MAIKNYSTTASNNTSVNSSSIAEGMAPSAINNSMREIVKDIRDGFNDKEWFLLGDGDATTTFTRASTTSVTVASDITSSYHVGRRVKVIGSNTGTIYGKIASSSYSSPNTTITFTFDSGNIPSSDTTVDVYVGSTFSNPATPVIDEDDLSSNSAILPPSQQSVKAYVDSGTATLSGKSIDLTNNTLTGTTAEFNTALSDNDFATIAGTETLTNKTLTSPVLNTAISGTAFKDEDDLSSDSATAVASQQSIKAYVDSGSTTLSNKTIDSANNTLTVDLSEATVTGTLSEFNTAVSDATLVSTTGTETLTNKTLTAPTVSSLTLSDSSIVFEGSTADDFETTLTAIDPTADRTVSIPNATTTLAGTDTTDTFTNKTISGNTNTLTDVPNSALTNSSVSFGGVSVSLGSSDATPAFDLTDATNYPTSSLTGTITNAQLAGSIAGTKLLDDAITTAKIIDDAVTTAKIVDDAVTIGKIADGVIVTNAEQSAHTVDDNTFFTTSASDARYFRQDSSETISSGDTWSASDSYVATTSAIDNRIVDLVDEVGGFVAIANETSFPTTNPDINDSTGTIVSISAIGTTRTPSSGTVTIANGSGSNTVTITGCGSTVLTAGYGVLVETTSTLHTYTFHRLVPKATEVTNVSSISSDITAVANDETDIGVVSGLSTDIQALADIEDGTSATNAISNVGNNISDVTTVATNLTGTDTIGTVASNLNGTNTIGSVGGSITNVNTVASNISSVNTTASNISGVNSFAERYRVGSSDPSSSLDQGDLFYNTTDTALKYYNGTAWASITAGITNVVEDVTPELGGDLSLNSNDITGTGNINITGTVTATNLSGAGAGVTSINASNISSGTLSNDRLSSIPNTALANSSITINGSSVALGGSITTAGDIESVTAGTGLSGGGASGAVTLDLDLNELTTSTSNADGDFFAVVDSLGNQKKLTKANINISEFNNDAGYLTSETDSQTLSFSSPNLTISNGNSVDISGITSGYLQNLSEDSTPQLGGSLDLNSNNITGTGNIDITGSGTFSGDLTVDTNTLYVDSTNNRVGIGTTSPTRNLSVVSGQSTVFEIERTAVGSESKLALSSATSFNAIYSRDGADSDKDLVFHTGSTERMSIKGTTVVVNDSSNDIDFRVESNNNTHALFVDGGNDRVGINTSSPATPLHVTSTSYPQYRITNAISFSMGVDSNNDLIFDPTSGSTRDIIFQNSGAGDIKVGISTTSPSTTLDVAGIGTFKPSDTTSVKLVNLALNSGSSSGTTGLYMGDASSGINVLTREKASINSASVVIYGENGFNVQQERLKLNPSSAVLSTGGTERMSWTNSEAVINDISNDYNFRVESNSNTHMLFVDGGLNRIGINDAIPSAGLTVNTTQAMKAGNPIYLYTNTNGNYGFIKNSGNDAINLVTIGGNGQVLGVNDQYDTYLYDSGGNDVFYMDSSQGSLLLTRNGTFAGTDTVSLNMSHYNDTGDPSGQIKITGSTNYAGDMIFSVRHGGTSGGGGATLREYIRIRGNERELVINETSENQDFRVESNNNTHALFVDAGLDRVGIGDSSPSYELTVKGSSGDTSIQIISPTDSDAGRLVFGDTSGGQSGRIIYNHSDNSFDFSTSGVVRASLSNSGTLSATAFSGDGSALTGISGGPDAYVVYEGNTQTTRNSGGVSSVSRTATGRYTVNFSSTLSSSYPLVLHQTKNSTSAVSRGTQISVINSVSSTAFSVTGEERVGGQQGDLLLLSFGVWDV